MDSLRKDGGESSEFHLLILSPSLPQHCPHAPKLTCTVANLKSSQGKQFAKILNSLAFLLCFGMGKIEAGKLNRTSISNRMIY